MLTFGSGARAALARISPPIWRVLAHSLLFGLAASVADLLFNFYLVSLGYAADAAGLLSTVYRAAGVVVGLPAGLLIDRIGPRRSLIGGIVLFAASWALLLLSRSLELLMASYFLAGASSIVALTSVVPLLTGYTRPQERTAVFGFNASAALLIGLVGSAVGGLLPSLAAGLLSAGPSDTASYRLALACVVVLGVLAVLPVLGLRDELPRHEAASDAPAEPERHSFPALLRLALPSLLLGVGGGLFLPFQNLFFRQAFGLSDAAVGAMLATGAVGMGLGALIGSPASARMGVWRAAWVLRLCCAPAMLLTAAPALLPALAGYFLRGLFIAASFPLNDALVMQSTPARQRGTAASLMSVTWSLGWASCSAISGWIQVRYGFAPVIVAASLAYVLSAIAIATQRVGRGG